MRQLKYLAMLNIPRFVASDTFDTIQLHLFCDASESAYGCAIYARTLCQGVPVVNLLTAKSRLAPRKSISIPRLELCAMLLGAKLLKVVYDVVSPMAAVETYAWSDSTIALSWVKAHPSKYETFVRNRIGQIQRTKEIKEWNHVPTQENPADHTTRYVMPQHLAALKIWWKGPLAAQ